MMICVFDTETTSLDKPFCYNIGYIIYDTENNTKVVARDFVVEQIWHNLPLFQTAYYANKRPLYVSAMRSKKTTMDKFGYICSQMRRDFKQYSVSCAYAYNSSFDEKVFNFNCDWFKCLNPFDEIPIYDIRGLVHELLVNDSYKSFCDDYELYTDSGNYSTTAEAIFRYITGNTEFVEEHTALADSEIELEILVYCIEHYNGSYNKSYATKRSIIKNQVKTLHLVTSDSEFNFKYHSIKINKTKTEIKLK